MRAHPWICNLRLWQHRDISAVTRQSTQPQLQLLPSACCTAALAAHLPDALSASSVPKLTFCFHFSSMSRTKPAGCVAALAAGGAQLCVPGIVSSLHLVWVHATLLHQHQMLALVSSPALCLLQS